MIELWVVMAGAATVAGAAASYAQGVQEAESMRRLSDMNARDAEELMQAHMRRDRFGRPVIDVTDADAPAQTRDAPRIAARGDQSS